MKTFIFDFDGVIGNTFELTSNFVADYLHISREAAREYVIDHSVNNRRQSLIRMLVKNFYIKKFEKFVRLHLDGLIFDPVLESIEKLEGNKFIVSRNHTEIMHDILNGKSDIFNDVYGYNSCKSKIDAMQDIIKKTGINKEDIVFVSDTIGDYKEMIQTLPHEQIYLVTWGFNSKKMITDYNSTIQLIEQPLEILELNKLD